jgi:hypothetical protein
MIAARLTTSLRLLSPSLASSLSSTRPVLLRYPIRASILSTEKKTTTTTTRLTLSTTSSSVQVGNNKDGTAVVPPPEKQGFWDPIYAIPVGIAFAVPAINYEWYLVNEETQVTLEYRWLVYRTVLVIYFVFFLVYEF